MELFEHRADARTAATSPRIFPRSSSGRLLVISVLLCSWQRIIEYVAHRARQAAAPPAHAMGPPETSLSGRSRWYEIRPNVVDVARTQELRGQPVRDLFGRPGFLRGSGTAG